MDTSVTNQHQKSTLAKTITQVCVGCALTVLSSTSIATQRRAIDIREVRVNSDVAPNTILISGYNIIGIDDGSCSTSPPDIILNRLAMQPVPDSVSCDPTTRYGSVTVQCPNDGSVLPAAPCQDQNALIPGDYELRVIGDHGNKGIYHLTIPLRGPKGDTGPAGPAGPAGPTGDTVIHSLITSTSQSCTITGGGSECCAARCTGEAPYIISGGYSSNLSTTNAYYAAPKPGDGSSVGKYAVCAHNPNVNPTTITVYALCAP